MTKIKMIRNAVGVTNEWGSVTRVYEINEILPTKKKWQKDLANAMLDMGAAMEVQDKKPDMEFKSARAKKKKG
jgi:hypothetical protein